jgi:sugar transferase (PEP-CTERM/EpsH1 system associated)
MNVLYVVPYVPNPVRVRPYQLIRGLAGLGHRISVLTLQSGGFDQESVAQLQADGIEVTAYPLPAWRSYVNCLAGLATSDPLQSWYCWNPGLAARLVELVRAGGFDVVHVEHMRGARFGQRLLVGSRRLPVVWDSVDCISHLFQQSARLSKRFLSRWITRFELARSRGYERRMAALFDRVLVTSPADRAAILSLFAPKEPPAIEVLPNGVDLAYFQPGPQAGREPDTLVVSGKMSYHANVSMALYLVEAILPRVWAEKPHARLVIAGKDPPRQIQALAADPRIQVTGYVPDLRPYLQSAAVAAAPLTYGAGIQNKVLEAMACATPVVASGRAASALDAAAGRDLLVAETPGDFAAQVLHLLNHPERARETGQAGRRYVEAHHDWAQKAARLAAVYCEEIERKKAL